MKRQNKLDIAKIPHLFSRFVILCLIVYIFANLYSMFELPDIKALLKNSGEKALRTIVSETLVNYHPTVKYIINDNKADDEDKKWQNKILKIAESIVPLYKYVDNKYAISLDKSDPSYKNNLVMFNAKSGENPADSGNDSTQANANVIIPMPELTGVQYSIEQLNNFEFLMKNFYTVTDATVVYNSDLVASELMAKDLKMAQDNSKPQILIYHTHSQEFFTDSVPGDPSTSIVGVGTYLAQILSGQFGYNVIHDTSSYDLVNGKLDRNKAYDVASKSIPQILADNPSIEVVLDIHRDGVRDNIHLVTNINGKPTAKIMFFNGMSRLKAIGEIDYLNNPNRKDNLAMSLQMKMLATSYYPDFTRRNYIDAYEYNLDLRPKSMLIEVGAQTNSLGEAKNAMEPLAILLNKLLK